MNKSTLQLKKDIKPIRHLLVWFGSGNRKLFLALLLGFLLVAYYLSNPALDMNKQDTKKPVQRGDILDTRGAHLTRQETQWHLYFNVDLLHRLNESTAHRFAEELANELSYPVDAAKTRITKWKGYSKFPGLLLTDDEKSRLSQWLASSRWSGNKNIVQFERQLRTTNPEGRVMSQVIGLVVDGRGKDGLQGAADDLLKQGASLTLSLDLKLQRGIEQELEQAAFALKADDAMAAVIRLKDFKAVALTSYPTNDPNFRANFNPKWQRLRPVTDVYQLGPMVEPFLLAGAYQHSLDMLPELRLKFISNSANVGLPLAKALGLEKTVQTLKQFSLDRKTGIELKEEARSLCCGQVDNPSRIDELGQGYAIATSLLRYASSFAGLVRDGYQSEIKLIDKVSYPDARTESPVSTVYGAKMDHQLARQLRYHMLDKVRLATGAPNLTAGGTWATYSEKNDSGRPNRIVSAAFFTPAYSPEYVVAIKLGLGDQQADANAGLKLGLEVIKDLAGSHFDKKAFN